MKRAKYICFEGIDGVGKTTQINMLASYLERKGYKVYVTKETDFNNFGLGSFIKDSILNRENAKNINNLTRELIFLSSRVSHYIKINEDILNNYDYVIQDRGALSGMVYSAALGVSSNFIEDLDKTVTRELNRLSPRSDRYLTSLLDIYDLIVVLDTNNPSWALDRAKRSNTEHRGGDHIENLGIEFFSDVSRKMYTMAPHWKTKHILVEKDQTKEQVFSNILDAISKRL